MKRAEMAPILIVVLCMCLVAPALAQQPQAATEYLVTVELLYGPADNPDKVLESTAILGARAEDVCSLLAAGGVKAPEEFAVGFHTAMKQVSHDAWGHLVVFAQSYVWMGPVNAVALPTEHRGDPKTLEAEGNGTYFLRPDKKLKLVDIVFTDPKGAKQALKMHLTLKEVGP